MHIFPISKKFVSFLPYIICVCFFIAYSILTIVRHDNYGSFGYDLGINDQAIWHYSQLQAPITTIDPYPDKTKLYEHVELVYAIISPIYWIWNDPRMFIITRNFFVCCSGLAIFYLAKRRKLETSVSFALLFCYESFYGVQNALWFDVHSVGFATAFLAWFLYFLDKKNILWTYVFLLLAITSKENIAFITFFIGLVYFVSRRDKTTIIIIVSSFIYLFFIFFIYFPYIIKFPYLYQNHGGLMSNLNPLSMIDTKEKLQTEFYTLFSYGFLPLLAPLSLLPAAADLATYFVIGSDLPGAQGLFMHYRITLAPLLGWAAIATINEYKRLNNKYVALYLVISALIIQYTLHLPLSYLSKSWFWQQPASVKTINTIKDNYLPTNASVVAQNNIIPHISHRNSVYSLYPDKKSFTKNSPCGKTNCNWFSWYDHPHYLLVDTAVDWDARHLLENRPEFIDGLHNLEKAGIIKMDKQLGTTVLYKVEKTP